MLKRRIAGNFLAETFSVFSVACVQILSVPIFLHFWSKEQYGIWLILFSIPSYMALADVGFSTAAGTDASMFKAERKMALARKSLHTGCGAVTGACIMLVLLAALILWVLPSRSLGWAGPNPGDIKWCVFFLSVYTVFGLGHMLYMALFRTANQYARCIYLFSFCRLVEVLASGVCLYFGGGFVKVAITLTLVRVLFIAIMHVEGLRLSPELKLGYAAFSWSELRRTWRLSLSYMAFPLGSAVYFQGLTLLTGFLLGPTLVVVFNTARALTRLVAQISTILKMSIMVEFPQLMGSGNMVKAKRINEFALELQLLIAIGLSVALFVFGPWLMKVWTHDKVIIGRGLLTLFLIGAVLNSLWHVSSSLLLGINRHGRLAAAYFIVSLLSIGLAALLAKPFGLDGLAWTMIFCELVLVPFTFREICIVLNQPFGEFLVGTLCLRQCRAFLLHRFNASRAKIDN
jgi:O-antigen/teichoic acid export membrane protein